MRRVPELDALRGLAAIVIVLYHLKLATNLAVLRSAVDLFFVLSGYLITTIILSESGTPRFLRIFYIRRGLRIWPIYYLYFVLAWLLFPWMPRHQPLDGLPYFLTYTQFIQDYWGGTVPACSGLFGHTWTLAIEEQFYLAWPILAGLAGRRYLPALIVPALAVSIGLRCRGYSPFLLLTRCDGLLLGAALAWIFTDPRRAERWAWRSGSLFVVAVMAALAYPVGRAAIGPMLNRLDPARDWAPIGQAVDTFRLCLLYFGVVGLVLSFSGRPELGWLRLRWLRGAGTISYGLYLFHPLVFALVNLLHARLGVGRLVGIDTLKLAGSFAVAALSWHLIERPLLSLKDRFPYGPATGPDPGQSTDTPPGASCSESVRRDDGHAGAAGITPGRPRSLSGR